MATAAIAFAAAYFGFPAWQQRQRQIRAQETAVAVQRFIAAFQTFARDHGDWPPPSAAGKIPAGMDGVLRDSGWTRDTPIGGHFAWQIGAGGVHAGISILAPDATHPLDARDVDAVMRTLQSRGVAPARLRQNARHEPMFVLED